MAEVAHRTEPAETAVGSSAQSVSFGEAFLPTFLFIFLGAPYIEWLSGNRRLQAALTGVTAAVVGVIANLAVFFGLRVLFPETGGFDVFAAVLALATFVILRRFAVQTYYLVPVGALAGMVWVLLGVH